MSERNEQPARAATTRFDYLAAARGEAKQDDGAAALPAEPTDGTPEAIADPVAETVETAESASGLDLTAELPLPTATSEFDGLPNPPPEPSVASPAVEPARATSGPPETRQTTNAARENASPHAEPEAAAHVGARPRGPRTRTIGPDDSFLCETTNARSASVQARSETIPQFHNRETVYHEMAESPRGSFGK